MGGGASAPRPSRLTPGKVSVPIVQEAGWAPGPVWTGAENLATTGIRSLDRLALRLSRLPETHVSCSNYPIQHFIFTLLLLYSVICSYPKWTVYSTLSPQILFLFLISPFEILNTTIYSRLSDMQYTSSNYKLLKL
jgi:hypothetical protein